MRGSAAAGALAGEQAGRQPACITRGVVAWPTSQKPALQPHSRRR